ncbi:MAG: hypothetical protein EAZ85_02790 [Bacteroidetes bacterium]|nr:MAG: hypothetical protein EAZ85_02790 [Bacteroidota bacterium]
MIQKNLTNYILNFLLVVTILTLIISISIFSSNRKDMRYDDFRLNNVKYGLFNGYEWKKQVSKILSKKLREFELTGENREQTKILVQGALENLFKKVILEFDKHDDIGFQIVDFFGDLRGKVRAIGKQIPKFAEEAMDYINNKDNKEKIISFIDKKLNDILEYAIGKEDKTEIDQILSKYKQNNLEECKNLITNELKKSDRTIWVFSLLVSLCLVVMFLHFFLTNEFQNISIYFIAIGCFLVLIGGVLTPIIDVDARIKQIDFSLLGENISFTNQYLFYQSKSIIEIVFILINSGKLDNIAIGFLIFLFSILFPVSKLLMSVISINIPENLKNPFVKFIVLKSSKWSMADVIVVAIFMAYIGFNGLISNQFANFENISKLVNILATDQTNLQAGFLLFTTFTISGLVFSDIIEDIVNKKNIVIYEKIELKSSYLIAFFGIGCLVTWLIFTLQN